MIQITPQMRVLVAVEPADFRRGIDGIARLCRERTEIDPFSGTVFVFRNRRASAIKVLVYDGQGFWLCHKRLSRGRFRIWPRAAESHLAATALDAPELSVLLYGGDPANARTAPAWKSVTPPGRYAVMVNLDSHPLVSIDRQTGHHLLLWWNAPEWNHRFVDTRRAIEAIVSRDAFLDTVSSESEAESRLMTGDYDALIIMGTDANLGQNVRDRFESEHGHIFGEFVCDISKVAPDRMASFLLRQLQ